MMLVTEATPSQDDSLLQQLVAQGQSQNQLQQSDFLSLMIAQLQNQDPLNPLEDQEFMNQITQFNILEQVTAFNDSLLQMQAYQATNLIGKHVAGFVDMGVTAEGDVVEVILINNTATLVLDDGTLMPLAGVVRVLPGEDPGELPPVVPPTTDPAP